MVILVAWAADPDKTESPRLGGKAAFVSLAFHFRFRFNGRLSIHPSIRWKSGGPREYKFLLRKCTSSRVRLIVSRRNVVFSLPVILEARRKDRARLFARRTLVFFSTEDSEDRSPRLSAM